MTHSPNTLRVLLLDSRLALLNPEFEKSRQPRNHKQADGSNRPARHTPAMGVIDDRHDHAQRGANRRNDIADPVHEVEEGTFRLGGRLALNRLICRRRAPEVLRLDKRWGELKENN